MVKLPDLTLEGEAFSKGLKMAVCNVRVSIEPFFSALSSHSSSAAGSWGALKSHDALLVLSNLGRV